MSNAFTPVRQTPALETEPRGRGVTGILRRGRAVTALTIALALASAVGAADQPRQWRWQGVERVVAVADVHGAYPSLVAVLRDSGLVSQQLTWIGGTSHLVMVGDLVDRGSRTREVLDLVIRLQREAEQAGGRVHVLLGNHEVMNLTGDLRYVSADDYASFAADEHPKEREAALRARLSVATAERQDVRKVRSAFLKRCPDGFFARRRCFAPDGVYGSWLLQQQILVVINDVAYVHGGLSPTLIGFEPDEINSIAMAELRSFVAAQRGLERLGVLTPELSYSQQLAQARDLVDGSGRRAQAAAARPAKAVELARTMVDASDGLAFSPYGPLWYRGSALNPIDSETAVVSQVLEHLGADRAVVGHTPIHTGRITTRCDGAVIRADTGMLTSHYGGRASAVVQAGGRLYSFYPGEGTAPLLAQEWEYAAGMFVDNDDIAEFLATAPIVSAEDLGTGSTHPQQVVLARNGQHCRAIFKAIDAAAPCPFGGSVGSCRDSYTHEVAAYRLDRILGLGMVPPTVIRTIDGTTGSLQLWVEGAINEDNRRDEDLRPKDTRAYDHQLDRAGVFDRLILNPQRNGSNLLITIRDWKVYLIDHSTAFAPIITMPADLVSDRARLDKELAARLAAIAPGEIRSQLGDLLNADELAALLSRLEGLLDAS